jgi:hypothetical protein
MRRNTRKPNHRRAIINCRSRPRNPLMIYIQSRHTSNPQVYKPCLFIHEPDIPLPAGERNASYGIHIIARAEGWEITYLPYRTHSPILHCQSIAVYPVNEKNFRRYLYFASRKGAVSGKRKKRPSLAKDSIGFTWLRGFFSYGWDWRNIDWPARYRKRFCIYPRISTLVSTFSSFFYLRNIIYTIHSF